MIPLAKVPHPLWYLHAGRKDVVNLAHNYLLTPPAPTPAVVIAYSAWPTEVVSFRDMSPVGLRGLQACKAPRRVHFPNLTHLSFFGPVLTDKRTSRGVFRCAPSTQVSENAEERAIPEGIPVMRASALEPRFGGCGSFCLVYVCVCVCLWFSGGAFSYHVPSRCRSSSNRWAAGGAKELCATLV
ncbi:hypothetical protein CORC01_11738 [Colletotrichum orchidophilum]|uniref:Uncharacterized protein n=1 Tax=Colletotrichum orchidophilum TaxID=1209926 RepID=A0A1G4AV11_9PEZI|nr:uncharacterized protein CORC01_11738 [Colletotrichum orchidophilum]OHE92945.1 hypothetical protein CORC01_11738 [Colletotrichum orchidophilum]